MPGYAGVTGAMGIPVKKEACGQLKPKEDGSPTLGQHSSGSGERKEIQSQNKTGKWALIIEVLFRYCCFMPFK